MTKGSPDEEVPPDCYIRDVIKALERAKRQAQEIPNTDKHIVLDDDGQQIPQEYAVDSLLWLKNLRLPHPSQARSKNKPARENEGLGF